MRDAEATVSRNGSKLVFAGQPATEGDGWTDQQLGTDYPKLAGLDGDALSAFQTCFTDQATADFVNSMQDALPSYVTSTPFFTVNGDQWSPTTADLASTDAMRQAIQQLVFHAPQRRWLRHRLAHPLHTRLILDDQGRLNLREIGTTARQWQEGQSAESAVIIAADKSVQYEAVVKAMDALQRAGVQRVGLSVKQGNP